MSADNNRPGGSLLSAMIQRRPWGRSASFESHAARYPRQHPPSRDRIHSAALPPRQRSTPTPDAFGQPPVKRGLQPRARPGPRPKVLNAFACLAPHAVHCCPGRNESTGGSCVAIRCGLSRKTVPIWNPGDLGERSREWIGRPGIELPAQDWIRTTASRTRWRPVAVPSSDRIARDERSGGSPLQRRALRSMSRLAIRRCGHTEVQEKGQRG